SSAFPRSSAPGASEILPAELSARLGFITLTFRAHAIYKSDSRHDANDRASRHADFRSTELESGRAKLDDTLFHAKHGGGTIAEGVAPWACYPTGRLSVTSRSSRSPRSSAGPVSSPTV